MNTKLQILEVDSFGIYCEALVNLSKILNGVEDFIQRIAKGMVQYVTKLKTNHKNEIDSVQTLIEDL